MNILVVSSYLPFPLHSGGDVRLYNLLKRLAKKHDITLVCEQRDHQSEDELKEIEKICKKVYTVQRKKQWSLQNIFSSILSPKHSFLITGHSLSDMQALISELIKDEKFDLIHVETSYVLQNIPQTSIPIVLTEHNIEYSVYQKYTDTSSFFLRPFLQMDVNKLRKEEQAFWRRATTVVAVSESDALIIQKHTEKDVEIVPNGVDLTFFKAKAADQAFSKKEKKILFIGNYKWIQNQRTLDFILEKVWPKLLEKTDSSVKLWIVGPHLPEKYQGVKNERVIIEGESDRPTSELFSDSFMLLAPLTVAGGTQYKILESMASGTPVATTALGIQGLEGIDKRTILVSDDPLEMVGFVLKLLSDKQNYKSLSKNGREYVEKNFSFEMIADKLEEIYKKTIKNE